MTRFHVVGHKWSGQWRYIVHDRYCGYDATRYDWIEAVAHAIQRNQAWGQRREAEVRRLERDAV